MRPPWSARRRAVAVLVPALILWLLAAACTTGATSTVAQGDPSVRMLSGISFRLRSAIASGLRAHAPVSSPLQLVQDCPQTVRQPCFTPAQVRRAYGVDKLAAQGIDGTGQTVVIIVSFGSPTLQEDVAAFNRATGLPDANITQLFPLGHDFQQGGGCNDVGGWAGETTLDVEWVHAIAPGASIVVLASPVAETEGVAGMPEFLALERYARDYHLGSIISQSWGTSEDLLADAQGAALRASFDAFYADATRSDLTVFSASGDSGVLGDTPDCGTSNQVSAGWPASAPWVTAVGGTMLSLNGDGTYGSERVLQAFNVAGGSGISAFYPQPAEQAKLSDAIQQQLGGKRGLADVSAIGAGLLVYQTTGSGGTPRPQLASGTSASTPVWAGIGALATHAAGGPIGNINPTLYALGAAGRCFHDVTTGSNAFMGSPGQPALPGWDFPSGWGTPDASCLVPALAAAARGT
jgi:subtilase family serine protease